MSTPAAPAESSTQALANAFAMIIVSEIGDKTFLLAAILAMRHPRTRVFAGAFGALVVMSLLSAGMGHVLPALVPRAWTQLAAAVLFVAFGVRMLGEGRRMAPGADKVQEEMREAEQEIAEDDAGADAIPLDELEAGERVPDAPRSPGAGRERTGWKAYADGARNFFAFCLGPVVVQSFVLTFLGEWGDRSQIATIALGAAHNMWVVAFGTILGHSICTLAAVLGGRYISTKISVKHVTLAGAVLFLLFGLGYGYEALSSFSSAGHDALDPPAGLPSRPDDPEALYRRWWPV